MDEQDAGKPHPQPETNMNIPHLPVPTLGPNLNRSPSQFVTVQLVDQTIGPITDTVNLLGIVRTFPDIIHDRVTTGPYYFLSVPYLTFARKTFFKGLNK